MSGTTLQRGVHSYENSKTVANEIVLIPNYRDVVKRSKTGEHLPALKLMGGKYELFTYVEGRLRSGSGYLGMLIVMMCDIAALVQIRAVIRALNSNVVDVVKQAPTTFTKGVRVYCAKILDNATIMGPGHGGFLSVDGALTIEVEVTIFNPVVPTVLASARAVKRKCDHNDVSWAKIKKTWLKRGGLHDVIVTCSGKQFPANRLILMSRSPWFDLHLVGDRGVERVNVEGTCVGLAHVLHYVCNDELESGLCTGHLLRTLETARYLHMSDLVRLCEALLTDELTKDNALDVAVVLYDVTQRWSRDAARADAVVPELQNHVRAVMRANPTIMTTNKWSEFYSRYLMAAEELVKLMNGPVLPTMELFRLR